MFCPNCGTNLPDNAQFCPNCGSQTAAPQAQVIQAQPTQQPNLVANVKQTLSKYSKKQLVTVGCVVLAVIVAVFLIFFFACGGCDTSTQKNIVESYVKAIAREDARAVADLYYPAVIEESGYSRYEYEEFADDEDECYYYYGGDAVKSYDITITSIEEMLEPYANLYSMYGYDIDDMMAELYEEFEDEYNARLSDIAIGVANVKFKNGDSATYSLILIKVSGKWYIALAQDGSIMDSLF